MSKYNVFVNCHQLRHICSHFETIIDQSKIADAKKSGLKLTNIFPDNNFTDYVFTDIIIHAKASSVQVMSVIIMSDNVNHLVYEAKRS